MADRVRKSRLIALLFSTSSMGLHLGSPHPPLALFCPTPFQFNCRKFLPRADYRGIEKPVCTKGARVIGKYDGRVTEYMSRGFFAGPFRHGLTFIATLAFVASFFASRLFAILFPNTVIMRGTIHLHHFWYGIALISVAGWMGIAWKNDRLDRLYALLYGLGAGFVGDEIGLLLTLGDYQSELSYEFFIGAISFVIIATLLVRYRSQLESELLKLSFPERALMIGVYVTGFSVFFLLLPSSVSLIGIPLMLAGLGVIIYTYASRRRTRAGVDRP